MEKYLGNYLKIVLALDTFREHLVVVVGLTGNIPEELFSNCNKVIEFGNSNLGGTFSGCSRINRKYS